MTAFPVKQWVSRENAITDRYLEDNDVRDKFKAELDKLYDYLKIGLPEKHGDYYYFEVIDGRKDQPIMYRFKEKDTMRLDEVINCDSNENAAAKTDPRCNDGKMKSLAQMDPTYLTQLNMLGSEEKREQLDAALKA